MIQVIKTIPPSHKRATFGLNFDWMKLGVLYIAATVSVDVHFDFESVPVHLPALITAAVRRAQREHLLTSLVLFVAHLVNVISGHHFLLIVGLHVIVFNITIIALVPFHNIL